MASPDSARLAVQQGEKKEGTYFDGSSPVIPIMTKK